MAGTLKYGVGFFSTMSLLRGTVVPLVKLKEFCSLWFTLEVNAMSLWSKIEKNTDKIAIQSFTVPRARE